MGVAAKNGLRILSGTTKGRRESEKGEARSDITRLGLGRVQLHLITCLTLEQYIAQELWRSASLSSCPLHPNGGCGFKRHTPYLRKYPSAALVARYYCPTGHTTFSLLPDFFAARLPGTLKELEEIVATAETASSMEQAVEELWPAFEEGKELLLDTALRRIRRRMRLVKVMLVTVAGLFPEIFAGCELTITSFRKVLGTTTALVALRGMAVAQLHVLPPPLGFGHQPFGSTATRKVRQQSMYPDRPP